MTAFDYRKLNGRIVEYCDTKGNFASKLGRSRQTVAQKLNSNIDFTQREIYLICKILEIKGPELHEYFFTPLVEKTQQN